MNFHLPKLASTTLVAIAIVAGFAATGAGDGAHFSPITVRTEVISMDQTVLIVAGARRTALVVRTGLRDAPEGAAWFMPVPARPRDLRTVTDPFHALDRLTARVWRERPHGRAGADGRDARERDGVIVDTRVVLGVMDVAVLQAESPEDLLRWLDREGFRAPAAAREVFSGYVERDWWWIVAKLTGDAGDAAALPKPLAFWYDAPAVYPMTISRLSADRLTDVLFFVVAPWRASLRGPDGALMPEVPDLGDHPRFRPEASLTLATTMSTPLVALLDAPIVARHVGRGMTVPFEHPGDRWRTVAMLQPMLETVGLSLPLASDDGDSPWITRFRMRLAPHEMRWDPAIIRNDDQTALDRAR